MCRVHLDALPIIASMFVYCSCCWASGVERIFVPLVMKGCVSATLKSGRYTLSNPKETIFRHDVSQCSGLANAYLDSH